MTDAKSECRAVVAAALNEYMAGQGADGAVEADAVVTENPPKPEMGDLGMPMFPFAKRLRAAPPVIAAEVVRIIAADAGLSARARAVGTFLAAGPYVNVRLDKAAAAAVVLSRIQDEGAAYGSLGADGTAHGAGRRVMVEFSSPNTNKPLHLGHLRNDALGESVSRILKKAGAEVFKVNIINNRGVHICKSMLAYKLFHEANGDTPESLGMKGDHFVGQCYVEFDRYAKEHPEANAQAEEMLVQWERGSDDDDLHKLWRMMNGWAIDGVRETYARTGVSFDRLYFESETYLKGRAEILKGVERGVFFRAADGSVRVDVTEATGKGKDGENQEKVLLRKDGTSVYITQDIGTAIFRHEDWAFNQMVYVVASEQNYHFKVLFYLLRKLGFDWADRLFHLSYGMVNLPNGRMKSREGTVVDADDLIDSLRDDALAEIRAKGREADVGDANEVAERVALAALHYYLLQITPVKDMVFNPQESLSFNGNTGPYLQYMGARIASILRKSMESGIAPASAREAAARLTAGEEWDLIKRLGDYPDTVAKAAETLDASVVAAYLYDVAKLFSKFYQQCPILAAGDDSLAAARLFLAQCTLQVLKDAMHLVLVPYLERM